MADGSRHPLILLASLSLPRELNDQAIAFDGQPLALALLDNLLSFIGSAECHKACSLGLALVIEQDVYLAHIQIEALEGALERVSFC